MNCATLAELLKGEEGERVNLKRAYKWVLNEMEYEDFEAFAQLSFYDMTGMYGFGYKYCVNKEHDSPSAREDYLKYLLYKLIQNIDTPHVKLSGRAYEQI